MQDKKMKNDQKPENMSLDINTDENMAGTNHLNEAVTEESEIEKLKEELREQKDKYLRLYAEFENYRKRSSKEKLELIQTAGKDVIVSLLEVLDDLDRGEKQMLNRNDEFVEGIRLVFNKLRLILQSRGLKPMECLGMEFNPDQHEAISEIPAPSEDLKGKVVDVLEKGYYLNHKIIRFAKVVVGK
jgi:molecular chaperone GrpE